MLMFIIYRFSYNEYIRCIGMLVKIPYKEKTKRFRLLIIAQICIILCSYYILFVCMNILCSDFIFMIIFYINENIKHTYYTSMYTFL